MEINGYSTAKTEIRTPDPGSRAKCVVRPLPACGCISRKRTACSPPTSSGDRFMDTTPRTDRRSFLTTAAVLTATAVTRQSLARDFGPNAPPQRYPDSDIVTL